MYNKSRTHSARACIRVRGVRVYSHLYYTIYILSHGFKCALRVKELLYFRFHWGSKGVRAYHARALTPLLKIKKIISFEK